MGDNTAAHEPAPIRQLSAPDLKALLESGTAIELVDVRTEEERAIAQHAAEYFRREGFRNLYNLRDGIDAWSLLVDPSVPRY